MIRTTMVAATIAGGMTLCSPVYAQATRTWISGVGDDVNPCSRTAPCKTFAGAISKTANGGEINCLDPGGFGGVTVTKAITLLCDTTEGGMLVAGTNGVTINAGDNDVVTISGVDIFGPTSSPGLNGVRFINGAGVNIRNTTIKGMSAQGVSFEVQAGKTAFLHMENVKILGTGTIGDPTTGGVSISPASTATANVAMKNVSVQGTANNGLRVDLNGTTGNRVNLAVTDSIFTGDDTGMNLRTTDASSTIAGNVTGVTIANNVNTGIRAKGAGITVRVGDTTITGNGLGISGASVLSYGDNRLDGNTSDGAFSSSVAPH